MAVFYRTDYASNDNCLSHSIFGIIVYAVYDGCCNWGFKREIWDVFFWRTPSCHGEARNGICAYFSPCD